MSDISYKTGIFLAYQVLDALYRGDAQLCDDSILPFGEWCMEVKNACTSAAFAAICDLAAGFLKRAEEGKIATLLDYGLMQEPLVALLNEWLDKITIRLYVQPDTLSPSRLAVRPNVFCGNITRSEQIPETCDGVIQLLLVDNYATCGDTIGRIDAIITAAELLDRVRLCYPLDRFDYDRLYLSGKLAGLTGPLNNVQIALAGSLQAASGFCEEGMKRPATSLAISIQDPYYAMQSLEQAKKHCTKIDTVVLCGGYGFWCADIAGAPDDTEKSMLGRVLYPTLKGKRAYKGDVPQPLRRALSDPFLERVSDFAALCDKENAAISRQLAVMPYYSGEFNLRPVHGALPFRFQVESEAANSLAAKAHAAAEAAAFSQPGLEKNLALLREFCALMQKKRTKVAVVVPPVAPLYREFAPQEARGAVGRLMEPLCKEHGILFLDLYDSPDYPDADFVDYDHLNEAGAEKFSRAVADLLQYSQLT